MPSPYRICILCFDHPPPGLSCLYDMHHEYDEPEATKKLPQPPKALDLNKCLKCGLHRKNPSSQTNGCEHQYPEK